MHQGTFSNRRFHLLDFFQAIKGVARSKALISGALSSAFEWYDYALFGYFAAIIGQQFFPVTDPLTALLSSFAVFASGFAMRPLGALLFGYVGDRLGRKKALVLSLVLMAIPTMSLGLLPNYETLGIGSSIGLLLIRLMQGLAVGGNYGGSFIFTIEHAEPQHKGLAGSLAMFGTLGGLLLGSGMATVTSSLFDPETLQSIGWRIPFLLGGCSAVIGYYIRHAIPESNQENPHHEESSPIKIVLTQHLGTLFKTMGIILLDGVGVYLLFVFMSTFASVFLKLPSSVALWINTASMTSLVIFIAFFGWLGDHVGQRKILKWVSSAFALLSLPLYFWLIEAPSIAALATLQGVFSIIVGAMYGALPATVVGAFPKHVRYTACSIAFNVSVAVFGGTAPFIATSLIQYTGSLFVPAIMLTLVGIISYCANLGLKENYLSKG